MTQRWGIGDGREHVCEADYRATAQRFRSTPHAQRRGLTHPRLLTGPLSCNAPLSRPSGYSRGGDRSPRLCCNTVHGSFPSRGSSHVWCWSRTPSAVACCLVHGVIPRPPWPVRGVISSALWLPAAMLDFLNVCGCERVSALGTSPGLSSQESCDSRRDAGRGTRRRPP